MVRKQKANFLNCVRKSLIWQKFSFKKFERTGLWGKEASDFRQFDLEYISEDGNRKFMLMENVWFGFPDPPEWRLAFSDKSDLSEWQECGYFYNMPESWSFPEGEHPIESKEDSHVEA